MSRSKIPACTSVLTQALAELRQGKPYPEAISALVQGLFWWGLGETSASPAELVDLGGPFTHPAWQGKCPAAIRELRAHLEAIHPTGSELGCSLEAVHWNQKTVAERGEGIYYTPPLLAQFMARLVLSLYVNELTASGTCTGSGTCTASGARGSRPTEKAQLPPSFVLYDPAVGTGAFLTAALQELASLPADLRPGGTKCDLLPLLAGKDVDAEAVYLTKVRLWLEVLPELKRGAASFPPLPGISIGDSLQEPPLWADVVLANPPYRRQEGIDPETKRFLSERFQGLLPRQVDLYGYFLANLVHILKPGAVAAVVTPVAWLEVDYGRALQDLLQQQLEIPLIITSACERWFQESAVHTAVCTFARRAGRQKPSGPTTLVNLLTPLATVPPEPMASLAPCPSGFKCHQDWQAVTLPRERLQALTHRREPVRAVWGTMLRAPAAYFTLHQMTAQAWTRAGELGEVRRGFTSGANAFFFVRDVTDTAPKDLGQKLGLTPDSDLAVITVGTKPEEQYFAVEKRFLLPLVKSPREVEGCLVSEDKLSWKVLLLPPDKDYIKGLKVADYIRWGEAQSFQHRPTLRARPLWWSLPKLLPPQVLARQFYDRRFNFPYNPGAILCDHTFYYLTGCVDPELIAALLNSTITFFHVELWGRSNMGDGVLTFYGSELADLPVVKPALFNLKRQRALRKCFRRLCGRAVLPIEEEVEQPDRQELDLVVLSALGLTGLPAATLLGEIYTALCQLVNRRQERSQF
jgi:hypothetical protein